MRLILVAVAMVAVAVLVECLFVSRARAQEHGYVEPCNVVFVQDSKLTCEECPFNHADLQSCAKSFGSRGYKFECRTRGHSAPAEIWCKPREGVNDIPRPLMLGGVIGGVAVFAAAFLWWKRRATG